MGEYLNPNPTREEIDSLDGTVALEFGTEWCGFCRAAHDNVESALAAFPNVRHIRVEDGKGRRLGRSFGVKLWPTLIFLHDGSEVSRVVRPLSADAVREALLQGERLQSARSSASWIFE